MDMYKEDYGKSIITCYARPVGQLVLLPIKETFLKQKCSYNAYVIYSDSADKATRFLPIATRIPLVFLQDVTDLWLKQSEHGGT
jgi:acetyl-CoA carboxylase carboxyltransferase component